MTSRKKEIFAWLSYKSWEGKPHYKELEEGKKYLLGHHRSVWKERLNLMNKNILTFVQDLVKKSINRYCDWQNEIKEISQRDQRIESSHQEREEP